MSFRNRLALFFVVIVIVPMLAVTLLLFRLIGASENGKADAYVGAQHMVARQVYAQQRDVADQAIRVEIFNDDVFTDSVQTDIDRAERRAEQLVERQGIERIVLFRGSRRVFSTGGRTAVAPARVPLQAGTSRSLGRLEVSVIDAKDYATRVKLLTGLNVVVRNGSRQLFSTLPGIGTRELPTKGEATIGDRTYDVVSFNDTAAFTGQMLRVSTLGIPTPSAANVRRERLRAGGILLGFFIVAIVCAVLVSRTLQQQIASFLQAARRLAGGDFSTKVPIVGRDEFAELGDEFNKMSGELERRLAELTQERRRVQDSMRRIGEAVASNLDRDALLELVVRTAVDGVAADAGRACVRTVDRTTLQERTRVGDMNGLEFAVESVEAEALRTGDPHEHAVGESNAIAYPLRGAHGGEEVAGVVSIGRTGRPFTASDRDLFHYLAGQAARSIENVERHETVARESVTDDLTGLSNRRAFDDALASEMERAKRFGTSLGLVLIDLDNFKNVNDTYGHQQGDVVLREVARVLRETSREIDHPARYGGEELAVVLPGTDLEGAFNLAERVRVRIAELRIPRTDGAGTMTVTTSCGVAATPPSTAEDRVLVAAADAALYEAKETGKNKSVRGR